MRAPPAARTPYWRQQYGIQLRDLPGYLVQRIAEIEPAPDNPRASYRQFTQGFINAYANLVNNPQPEDKTHVKLGSTVKDQVFYPIVPCRIVDTRNSGGPITAGTARNFTFFNQDSAGFSWSTQGGASGSSVSACPQTVITNLGGTLGFSPVLSAAMATVTVVNATAAGNWLIWVVRVTRPASRRAR